MKEKEILEAFIRSGVLSGEWYLEVPVGLEYIRKVALEEWKKEKDRGFWTLEKETRLYSIMRQSIDAVFVRSTKIAVHPKLKVKYYLDRYVNFDGKRVWLMEAKKDFEEQRGLTAIGQILTYRCHFKRDWKALIEGVGILCGSGNELIEEACKELSIRVWRISEDKKVKRLA